uniref:SCP domain-containing protein n=1 Tax=Strongyloides papillosus TaxID=174720 RepID=A0A0N5BYH7_STREA
MIGSLTANDRINYVNKKQDNVHSIQNKFKKVNLRKPFHPRTTTNKKPLYRRTTPRGTTPRKTPYRKPLTTKTTRKVLPNKQPPTKKPVLPNSKPSTTKLVLPTTRPNPKPKTTATRKTQTSKATKSSTITPTIDKSKIKPPMTTTSVTTTPKHDNLSKYINKSINDINALRVEYKRNPLVVNEQLAREAQNYSNHYVKNNGMLEPYENKSILEYICFNNELNNFDAVNYWARNDDNEEVDDSWEKFLHPEFGQLIAKNATHIGCGINKTIHFTALFCKIHPAWNADEDDY